ncbi:hypothetical protein BDW74DRAFT_181045 [Aspergillus multicolor]|uniref:uncharacterized protein n=1 Tax=Aspergillus multicolor TaxID=41759 RepID=UPI003CCD17EE
MDNPTVSKSRPLQTTLAAYLFTRLSQLEIHTLHGVPGDFNIPMLEFIKPAGLRFVESTTELNAAYAADAYARVRGVSALITSYSYGEPAALPAIYRSFADNVPLILIAGVPTITTPMKTPGPTSPLPRPDTWCTRSISSISEYDDSPLEEDDEEAFDSDLEPTSNPQRFAEAYKPITAAQAKLLFRCAAAKDIDRVLEMCLRRSQPVYIEVPVDTLSMKIDCFTLERPISTHERCNRPHHELSLVRKISGIILEATKPLIIVDAMTRRFDLRNEASELVRLSGWPAFSTPAGKGCINETLPSFSGIYPGSDGEGKMMVASRRNIDWAFARSYLAEANLIIRFGAPETSIGAESSPLPCLAGPDPRRTLDITRRRIRLPGDPSVRTSCEPPNTKNILKGVLEQLTESRHHILLYPHPMPQFANSEDRFKAQIPLCPDALIDGDTFWLEISHFLKENDVVLTEATGTGISRFGSGSGSLTSISANTKNVLAGAKDLILPANTNIITTPTKCGLAASVGVSRASRDRYSQNCGEKPRSRTILFIDTRSFQKTSTALRAIFRNKLNAVIFLLNPTKANSNANSLNVEGLLSPRLPGPANTEETNKKNNREASIHDTSSSIRQPILLAQNTTQAQSSTSSCTLEILDGILSAGAPKRDPIYPVITRKVATWGQLKHVISDGRTSSGRGFSLIEVMVNIPCDFGVHLQLQESKTSRLSQNSQNSQYEMRYANELNWPLPNRAWQEIVRNPYLSFVFGFGDGEDFADEGSVGLDHLQTSVQDSLRTSVGASTLYGDHDALQTSVEELDSYLEEQMKASDEQLEAIEEPIEETIRVEERIHVQQPPAVHIKISGSIQGFRQKGQTQRQRQNNAGACDEITLISRPLPSIPQAATIPTLAASPHPHTVDVRLLTCPKTPKALKSAKSSKSLRGLCNKSKSKSRSKNKETSKTTTTTTKAKHPALKDSIKKKLGLKVRPPPKEEYREISVWSSDSSDDEDAPQEIPVRRGPRTELAALPRPRLGTRPQRGPLFKESCSWPWRCGGWLKRD